MRPQGWASTSLGPRLGQHKPRHSPSLSILSLLHILKPSFVLQAGRPPGPNPRIPCGQEHRGAAQKPCLFSRPPHLSLGGLWGLGIPRQRGRCSAGQPCRQSTVCGQPPTTSPLPDASARSAPGGPVLTCPFPFAALLRTPPRGGQMCRLWSWRPLMRSRCASGPRAHGSGCGYQRRGRPWEGAAGRGGAGGMRWDGFPLECELGISLPK